MSTTTVGTDPIAVARGKPGSLPMRWQDPQGVAINVTDFAITAELRWSGAGHPLAFTLEDAVDGRWLVSWSGSDVADLPLENVAFFFVVITEPAGSQHTFIIPVTGTMT